MMGIKPIHTKADHQAALKLVSRLVDRDPAPGTPDGDMLEVMATLVRYRRPMQRRCMRCSAM